MRRKILIVDDDLGSLQILEKHLSLGENISHKIIRTKNGQEALDVLHNYYSEIDVILLDRMMPIMTGDEFMQIHNKDERFKNIPVIMQTLCGERNEIIEGFKLGVYHYLTKPYVPDILNSVVQSAISFNLKQNELLAAVKDAQILFNYAEYSVYKIKKLDDIKPITISLAYLFPVPAKVIVGISEILTNSIEHGNVGITYEEKTQLNIQCKWKEEVERRLNQRENMDKAVVITYERKTNEIVLNIKDQGNGFDYEQYLNFDPNRSTDNHGRGIATARKESFDRLEYVGNGNEVNCIVTLD